MKTRYVETLETQEKIFKTEQVKHTEELKEVHEKILPIMMETKQIDRDLNEALDPLSIIENLPNQSEHIIIEYDVAHNITVATENLSNTIFSIRKILPVIKAKLAHLRFIREENQGTIIPRTGPFKPKKIPANLIRPDKLPQPINTVKIWLVDDSVHVDQFKFELGFYLKKAKHNYEIEQVFQSTNQVLAELKKSDNQPGLIIMDLSLPKVECGGESRL